MPVAEARILTPRAERFLAQLCRHAEAMSGQARNLHGPAEKARPEVVRVEHSDAEGTITFTWGDCVLRSTSDTLAVRVEAGDGEQLARMQDILTADLERFGRRDGLKVSWHLDGVAQEAGVAPRRRGTTIALVAAATLAIAAHVVFGGAALAAWRWTSVAADILLALVVLKIVVVALFARRRFGRHGIGLASHFPRRKRSAVAVGAEQVVRAEASVPTERAERYAKQLCSHAAWKAPRAEWTPPDGIVEFPDGMGICRLTAEPDCLKLAIEATSPANLAEMQQIIGGLVARFAGRERLEVSWTPS